MPPLPLALKERLPLFARTVPGAELIDDLVLTAEQKKANKADIFFQGRRIICETKVFNTDTAWKIERLLEPHKRRREWPIFYGAWDLYKILRNLPDGPEIHRQIFEAITSAINKFITEANRQIRETKRTFGLPESGGLLVIGNDSIGVLSPPVIAHKVKRMLDKRTPEGTPRFPHINTVWMISENYLAEPHPGKTGIPSLLLQQDLPDPQNVEGFTDQLQTRWAAFHGVPVFFSEGDNIDEIPFQKHRFADGSRTSRPFTRSEAWIQEYRSNPYLAHLSVPRLVRHARRIFAQISPGMLKGASEMERMMSLRTMQPWTHLLEEVNRRGLDMRELAPAFGPVKSKLRDHRDVKKFARLRRNDLCPCGSGENYKNCHAKPY
jgi:SEC-C motif